MCGIFGWLPSAQHSRNDIPTVARAMCQALAHRGPDDHGWAAFDATGALSGTEGRHDMLGLHDCSLLLGQTRLSIIDLSPAGRQPMYSPDGRYTLVYNGEIYNYLELRAELEADGTVFRSRTDSEVLLHAFIRWGQDCLARLTGMFAFALFDAREKTLLCVRDPFGIKPLYYAAGGHGFAFASELPALLRIPGIARSLDRVVACNFLLDGWESLGVDTMVRGVRHLAPAHWLTVNCRDGTVGPQQRWWHGPLPEPQRIGFADAADQLRERFLESVRLHLRSDVPLGVALSGGIDSSAVICAVRYLEPEAELHAFSYAAADQPEISEARWIDIAGRAARASIHTTRPVATDLPRDVDELVLRLGEPFGTTWLYPQLRVNRLARDAGVKVLLNGEGGDETLGGYLGYPQERLCSLLGRGKILEALRYHITVSRLPGINGRELLKALARAGLPVSVLRMGRKLFGKTTFPSWLNADDLIELRLQPILWDKKDKIYHSRDKVRETLANSLTWYGLPKLLSWGDRCAMAFSVENRVPFLTKELASFCLSLPEHYLVDEQGVTKAVFRAAMRGIVPDAILDRKDKIGFANPEEQWLRASGDWVRAQFQEAQEAGKAFAGMVRYDDALALWDDIAAGRRIFTGAIWRILCFSRWKALLNITE